MYSASVDDNATDPCQCWHQDGSDSGLGQPDADLPKGHTDPEQSGIAQTDLERMYIRVSDPQSRPGQFGSLKIPRPKSGTDRI